LSEITDIIQLAEDVEKGDFKKILQLKSQLIEEGLFSPQLIKKLIEKGERGYLEKFFHLEGKSGLYLLGKSAKDTLLLMTDLSDHYSRVLDTKSDTYLQGSPDALKKMEEKIKQAIDSSDAFIGMHIAKSTSMLAMKNKRVICYADMINGQSESSVVMIADKHNIERIESSLEKYGLKKVTKYDIEECNEFPWEHQETAFAKIAGQLENIR